LRNGKLPTIGSLGGPGGKFWGFLVLKNTHVKSNTMANISNMFNELKLTA